MLVDPDKGTARVMDPPCVLILVVAAQLSGPTGLYTTKNEFYLGNLCTY